MSQEIMDDKNISITQKFCKVWAHPHQCFIFHTRLLCNHYTLQAHPGQTHCVTLHTWRSLNCTQHCDSMQLAKPDGRNFYFYRVKPADHLAAPCKSNHKAASSLPTSSHNDSQLEQISMGGLQALATCNCCRPISPRLQVGTVTHLGLHMPGVGV